VCFSKIVIGATSNLGKPSAGDSALTSDLQSRVEIINRCPDNDFRKAHASVLINGKIYLGTRADGIVPAILICYNNMDDLTDSTKISMPFTLGLSNNGLENICHDSVNGKLYCTLSGTRNLLVVNDLDDITDYDIVPIDMTSGISFGGSSSTHTDGTHIYVGVELTPAYFVKIDTSDFSVVQEVEWVNGGNGSHSGYINLDQSYVAFVSGSGNKVAKVPLGDMSTFTEGNMPPNVYTDDVAFVPAFPLDNDCIIAVGENRIPSAPQGGAIFNLDTMTSETWDMLPGFATLFVPNDGNGFLYSCSLAGFIERWDGGVIQGAIGDNAVQKDLMDVFVMPDNNVANEILVHKNIDGTERFFVTLWGNDIAYGGDGKGSLAEITFHKVSPSAITKYEIVKRFQGY